MKVKEVPRVVRAHEKAGNAVMLWSPPGIGKSDVVRQMCEEDGVECVDIRLALLNPVDLRGIPMIQGDKVVWVPPVFLVNKGPCRFFLDEINLAPPATQGCAYQWVLDGKIGEWSMDRRIDNGRPRHTIIAAGNRLSDLANVNQMPAPLRNRMAHVEVTPDLDGWREWAWKKRISRDVINFLTYTARVGVGINEGSDAGLLFFFDRKIHSSGAFPTPRSWEQLSRFVEANPEMARHPEALAGMVGEAVAQKFAAFVAISDKLPDVEEIILRGKLQTAPPREPSAVYAMCGAITATLIRAKKEDRVGATKNAVAYCNKWWANDAEFAVLTMKDFGQTKEWLEIFRNVLISKEWKEFTKTFGILMEE